MNHEVLSKAKPKITRKFKEMGKGELLDRALKLSWDTSEINVEKLRRVMKELLLVIQDEFTLLYGGEEEGSALR